MISVDNLSLYFNHLEIKAGGDDFADVELIVSATFPVLEKEILKSSLQSFASL